MAADRHSTLEERTRYEPADVESRVFARWQESGIFHPEALGDSEENYSIAVPPPNVTGSLHMGHALNGSIQDLCIRLARMRGRRAKWIYGTDHAGIAVQRQVEKALEEEGTTKEELGREAVRRPRLGLAPSLRLDDHGAVQAPGRLARLRGRALHDGRRLPARRRDRVRAPV